MQLVNPEAAAVVAVLSADLDLGCPVGRGRFELLGELDGSGVIMLVDHHDVVVGLGISLVGLDRAIGLAAVELEMERQRHATAVGVVLRVEVESGSDGGRHLKRRVGSVVTDNLVTPRHLVGSQG